MSNLQLRTAERKQARLRIGMFGPSGAGKTMSALRLAHGMTDWTKIAIIDTENGSADLYSHIGPYLVLSLTAPYSPERYIEAIKACEEAGAEVIIIDSITHEWSGVGGILELADQLSVAAKNSFTVWNKLTPRHNAFIKTILESPRQIICCGRTKQEYVMNEVEKNGKKVIVPEKIGLKAITREGFDFEMTISFDIAINHYATTTKDRTGLFMGKPEFVIDESTGQTLKEWNASAKPDPIWQKREIMTQLRRVGMQVKDGEQIKADIKQHTGLDLVEENYPAVIQKLTAMEPIQPEPVATPPVQEPAKVDQPAPISPEPAKPELTEEEKQAEEAKRKAEAKEARAKAPKPSGQKITLLKSMLEQKEGIAKDDEQNQVGYLQLVFDLDIENLSELTDEECSRVTKKIMSQPSKETPHAEST